MSNASLLHGARGFRPTAKATFLALTAAVALSASGLSAMAQSGKSAHHQTLSREFRAEAVTRDAGRCLPANGAQIWGGFAGADDRLDSVTGEICAR